MRKPVVLRREDMEKVLRSIGVDPLTAGRLSDEAVRSVSGREPRLHSSLTVHEAQDWLAANDPAGADYWRGEPLTEDLIATVGEHLAAVGNTRHLILDQKWQERYLSAARGQKTAGRRR